MNKKLKKQIYNKLCLKEELTDKEKKEYDLFIESGGNIGLIKNTCCHCGKKLKEVFIITSYWTPMWKPCCSEKCANEGYKKEEFECQKIDANCNECKFFKRECFDENTKPQTHNLFQPIGCYVGTCLNKKSKYFNKKIGANRNLYQGMECFVHRNQKGVELNKLKC